MAHVTLVERRLQLTIMLIGNEIGYRLAKVPEKLVARLRAFDDVSGEDRHPGHRIVSAPSFELTDQVVGPVLGTRLPAVADDVMDPRFADQTGADDLFVAVEIPVEVLLHESTVELVDLQSCGFRSGRVVGDTEERVAETQQDPVAGWSDAHE